MARVIDARKSRILLGTLVVAHVVVVSQQVESGNGTSLLEQAVFVALSPLQRAVSGVVRGISRGWSGYVDMRGVHEENQRLQERVRYLELLLQERQQRADEADRLRALLELKKILPFETVVSEVIAHEGVPWFRTITLNKGRHDGVRLEAPVISPSGVVGRVIAVGPAAARVQLLLDRDSGVGVRIERSRTVGVVSGKLGPADSANTDLELKYVPAFADVVVGDVVVTSGTDRMFPKGLVVGRVRSVGSGSGLFKEILVAPSARFDSLESLLVVKGEPEDLTLSETVH
jgi:rod shape-determining protein MreC